MEHTKDKIRVRWAELLPDEFLQRQQICPIVYLPMGLCEPHGRISAFGLDTLKADFICESSAREAGGIVAPTQGYHIHETGYHAQWLDEKLGVTNPRLASVPPNILLHFFLYQLRAFSNAGFKGAVVITGHAGGNQDDLRMVAFEFMKYFDFKVDVRADPELVSGLYEGDHAGKYEISQLMYIHPELVDMSKTLKDDGELGIFALGNDALDASPQLGREIIEACISETCRIVNNILEVIDRENDNCHINYDQIESIWDKIISKKRKWRTNNMQKGQPPCPQKSPWKVYERPQ